MKTKLTASALVLSSAIPAFAEEVEIYLVDLLDNTQNGYCIDIAKGREEAANPDDGLQGHTCYSPGGSLGFDQTFETTRFTDNTLYMVNFDVCAVAESLSAGSAVALATCDGTSAQRFQFDGEGQIRPAEANDLCVTLAADTRSGRSDANQIKVLSLEACDDALGAYQTWAVRTAQ